MLALPAELVAGKTCEIAKRDSQTLGYVVFGARRLRVDVPDGHGKIERIPIASARDVTWARSALNTVAQRHAKGEAAD